MSDLMDKKIDDMTVGDSLKLQGYILAGMAGIAALTFGGLVAAEYVSRSLSNRKLRKQTPTETE